MSHLLDDDDDLRGAGHRELNLSTGAVLGIFFGLVLLCGLFFGFGYNMGGKAHQAAALSAAAAPEAPSPTANFNAFKPSAGSPAGTPAPPPSHATEEDESHAPAATPSVVVAPSHAEAPAHNSSSEATIPAVRPITLPRPSAAPSTPPAATPFAPGSFVVQIAAVSHEEDADLLVAALRRKGYTVMARNEPQDKLLHIQVGPFANRKDADAMRQRLLTDGYNALVK